MTCTRMFVACGKIGILNSTADCRGDTVVHQLAEFKVHVVAGSLVQWKAASHQMHWRLLLAADSPLNKHQVLLLSDCALLQVWCGVHAI
jgi:hypothetical protein